MAKISETELQRRLRALEKKTGSSLKVFVSNIDPTGTNFGEGEQHYNSTTGNLFIFSGGEWKTASNVLHIRYAASVTNLDTGGIAPSQGDVVGFSELPYDSLGDQLAYRGLWFGGADASTDPTDYQWTLTSGANGAVPTYERYYSEAAGLFSEMGDPTNPGAGITWIVTTTTTPSTAYWVAERYTIEGVVSEWQIYPVQAKDGGIPFVSYTKAGFNMPVLGDSTWIADAVIAVSFFTGKAYTNQKEFGYGTTVVITYDNGKLYGTFKRSGSLDIWAAPTSFIDGDLIVDGTISTDHLQANSIDATKLVITGLNAITYSTVGADELGAAADAQVAAAAYVDAGFVANSVRTSDLALIQLQLDGSITSWFLPHVPTLINLPTSDWTTNAIKNQHLADLFYDDITGYAYRFTLVASTYSWVRITDTDVTAALNNASTAQDTADSKRRVFVVTPVSPYDVGDLWDTGAGIKRCITPKAPLAAYVAGDWVQITDAEGAAVTAKTEAIAAAAIAAQTKADLAQVTAEAYADGIVTAEEARAILDATNKADAAQAAAEAASDVLGSAAAAQVAAINAAAIAAQTKADLAQTTAEAYADGIVTAEEARAILDATTKANAAQAAAEAASDALGSAAAAQVAAIAASATASQANADLAETTAKAYADGIVTAEEARAILDATTKADAAQAAAELASDVAGAAAAAQAASDPVGSAAAAQVAAIAAAGIAAQTKADLAQTTAEAYADGIVTAEEVRAILDATNKANAAQAAAEAASDAAGTAQAAADVITNNIYTTATTTIDGGKITTDSVTSNKISMNGPIEFNAAASGLHWNKNAYGDGLYGGFIGRHLTSTGADAIGLDFTSATSSIRMSSGGRLVTKGILLETGVPGTSVEYDTVGTHTFTITSAAGSFVSVVATGGGGGGANNWVDSFHPGNPGGGTGAATTMAFLDSGGSVIGSVITAAGGTGAGDTVSSNAANVYGVQGGSSLHAQGGAGGSYNGAGGNGSRGSGGGGAGGNGNGGNAASLSPSGSGVSIADSLTVPAGAVSLRVIIGSGGSGGSTSYPSGTQAAGGSGGAGFASVTPPASGSQLFDFDDLATNSVPWPTLGEMTTTSLGSLTNLGSGGAGWYYVAIINGNNGNGSAANFVGMPHYYSGTPTAGGTSAIWYQMK